MSDSAYRLKGRIHNGRLWTALQQTFPGVENQKVLADAIGIKHTVLNGLLTMRMYPGSLRGWSPTALLVSEVLGETPEYLFDPTLYKRGVKTFSVDVSVPQLEAAGLLQRELLPGEALDEIDKSRALYLLLSTLPPREYEILERRNADEPETLQAIADDMGLSQERIRQMEAKAYRRLRSTSRASLRRQVRETWETR